MMNLQGFQFDCWYTRQPQNLELRGLMTGFKLITFLFVSTPICCIKELLSLKGILISALNCFCPEATATASSHDPYYRNWVQTNRKARHALTSYSSEFICELAQARGKAHPCACQGTEWGPACGLKEWKGSLFPKCISTARMFAGSKAQATVLFVLLIS